MKKSHMGKALGSSKLTVRYQITVPEEVRKILKIKDGGTIVFVLNNDKIEICTEF